MSNMKCRHCGKELSEEEKKRIFNGKGECMECLIATETAERKRDASPEFRAMDEEAEEAEMALTPKEEEELPPWADSMTDDEWRDARREYFENYEDTAPSMDEPGGSDWNC